MTDIPEELVERGALKVCTAFGSVGCNHACFACKQTARTFYVALRLSDLRALAGPEYAVVPKEPSNAVVDKGREKMPVEQNVWSDGTTVHIEPRPIENCVSPKGVYQAMLAKTEEESDVDK